MTEEIVAPVQTEETVRAEMPEIIDSTPTESAGKKEKFYGIELLRILATFYIIRCISSGRAAYRQRSGPDAPRRSAAPCFWHLPTRPSIAMRSSAALSAAKAGLSCQDLFHCGCPW